MKKPMLKIGVGLSIFLICILIALTMLILVYSIPTEKIEKNIAESVHILNDEGVYHHMYPWCTSKLDNYTDSLMLLSAEYKGEDSVFADALQSNFRRCKDKDPFDSLCYHYIEGVEYEITEPYNTYWHGYLVVLKPLLTIMNYGELRILNTVFQILLFCILFAILIKINNKELIVPYAITILVAAPTVIFNSLQFSSCFIIIILSNIFMLLIEKCKSFDLYAMHLFFITGIVTSFFDLLTYPLATYSVSAVLYMYLSKKTDFKDSIFKILKSGISWALGYFGFWSTKWIISSIFLKQNVIEFAIESAKYRTSGSSFIAYLRNLAHNVLDIFFTPFMLLAIAFFVIIMIKAYKKYKIKKPDLKNTLNRFILPYILIAILPFIWYVVLNNHSSLHYFYTNKALLGTVFSFLIIATDLNKNFDYFLNK